ncbi:hypothetical protein GYA49_02420 [Candidatus Beckwithbacteria bacterium]|nr:hypothetical protein [Candidatus Beckwithbacteria bacterium]
MVEILSPNQHAEINRAVESNQEYQPTREEVFWALEKGRQLLEELPTSEQTSEVKYEIALNKKRGEQLKQRRTSGVRIEVQTNDGRKKRYNEGIQVTQILLTTLNEIQRESIKATPNPERLEWLHTIYRTLTSGGKKQLKSYGSLPEAWQHSLIEARAVKELEEMEELNDPMGVVERGLDGNFTGPSKIEAHKILLSRWMVYPPTEPRPVRSDNPDPESPIVVEPPESSRDSDEPEENGDEDDSAAVTIPVPPTVTEPVVPPEKLVVSLVDTSHDAKRQAYEAALRWTHNKMRGERAKKWYEMPLAALKSIPNIRFKLFERYFVTKKTQELMAAQITAGHQFLELDDVTGAAREINQGKRLAETQSRSTLERFGMIGRDEVKTFSGETAEVNLSNEVQQGIQGLISEYAQGNIRPEELDQKVEELVESIKAIDDIPDYVKNSDFIAANIKDIAEEVKGWQEAGHDVLGRLDDMLTIQFGRAFMATSTDADFSKIERYMNWTKSGKFRGWLANPLAIGVISGLASGGVRSVLRAGSSASGLAAKVPGIGLAIGATTGAVFAGLRRWTDLKNDREMQELESAAGFYPGDTPTPRRDRLNEFSNMLDEDKVRVTAKGLLGQMDALISQDLSEQEHREALLKKAAEINARINFGIETKTDLISFDTNTPEVGRYSTASQRLELVKVVVEAKQQLIEARIAQDIDPNKTLEQKRAEATAQITRELDIAEQELMQRYSETKEEKDKAFNSYRLGQAVKAGAFGGATALVGGILSQEGIALAARGLDSAGIHLGGTGQTAVESWLHIGDRPQGPNIASLAELYQQSGSGGEMNFGEHVKALINPDHSLTLVDTTTNQPLTGLPKIFSQPNGKLIISGNPENLPVSVKDIIGSWGKTETVSHSLQEQVREAAAQGQSTVFEHEGLRLNLDLNHGQQVFVADAYSGDNIGVSKLTGESLQFTGDQSKLSSLHDILKNRGFGVGVIEKTTVNTPSLLEKVKEVVTAGGTKTFGSAEGMKAGLTMTVNGHDVIIQPGTAWHGPRISLHGTIAGDGSLTFLPKDNPGIDLGQAHQVLDRVDFTTHLDQTPGSGQIVSKDAPVLDHFRGLGQTIDKAKKLLWHFNNTPMHYNEAGKLVGADGKELLTYFHALKDGSAEVDMSKMVSNLVPEGGLNWDSSIDPEYARLAGDIITKPDGSRIYQNFEVLFTPFKGAKEVIVAQMSPDGHLIVPPGTDLSQLIKVVDNKVSLEAAFLEIAHRQADGRRTILSTVVGKGLETIRTTAETPGETILTAIPHGESAVQEVFNLEAKLPTAFELTPPFESAPLIPTPLEWRYPLEDLLRKDLLIYYQGYEVSQERKDFYKSRRSPRLSRNPEIILNPNQEIGWYFRQQERSYLEELNNMDSAINEPMSNSCRVAICIAAASHQEGENIYNTLLQYADQTDLAGDELNPNDFEIILFLNRPSSSTPDKTKDEVERFKRDHPEVKIRVIEKIFPEKRPNMGVISKYVSDMALLRSQKRDNPLNNDLLLVANDADAELISRSYVSSIINNFDNPSKKHQDGALGKIEWNPEAYIKYPGFHVANRFYQFLEAVARHDKQRKIVGSSGANFAIKSSIYAAVGGYNTETDVAQDVELGNMIKEARKKADGTLTNKTYPIGYIGGASIITNPRRGLSYYTSYNGADPDRDRRRRNSAIVHQWSDFASRDNIRDINWLATENLLSEDVDSLSIEHLEDDINAIIGVYGYTPDSPIVKRILNNFLGINFTVIERRNSDNMLVREVKITDIEKLKRDLIDYKNEKS